MTKFYNCQELTAVLFAAWKCSPQSVMTGMSVTCSHRVTSTLTGLGSSNVFPKNHNKSKHWSNSFCVSVCAAGLLGWYWAGQVLSGPARRVTSPASDSGHTDTGDTGRKWAACKVRNAGYKSIKGWGAGLFYHLTVPPLTCSTTTNGIRGLGTWI